MNRPGEAIPSRVLVIDDNQAIHEDFRKIFAVGQGRSRPSEAEIALFGGSESPEGQQFEMDSAYQGQEGLERVRLALERRAPYAVAFVDVRMPPGWDGIDTTARIWEIDADIQIVICTAYSDYSWGEMLGKLGRSDRLVILKKPFDTIEVLQLATALTEKWRLARLSHSVLEELERKVAERTQQLVLARDQLQTSATQYRLLFDRNPHPMWVYDAETLRFLAVNSAAVQHYGYSAEEFLAMSIRDIRPTDDVAALESALKALPDGAKEFGVWRHRKHDGSLIQVQVSADSIAFDGRPARLALVHDVTERLEQQRKIARLNRIRAVIGGISSAMLRLKDRDELLQEACQVASTEGVFPLAWVTAVDARGPEFLAVAAHPDRVHSIDAIKQALGRTVALSDLPSYRAAQSGRPVIINNLAAEPDGLPIRAELLRCGFCAGGAFPLFVEGAVVAVLILMATECDVFDAEEIALLEWLTADLSFALEYIHNAQRLAHLAHYDALTGVCNAGAFYECLDKYIEAARRIEGKVCVVLIDLEGFTQINDSRGRKAGDDLLRAVAGRFRQFLMEPYSLCRIGSDTFAAASPRDGGMIATELRDRMQDALRQPFELEGREVTVSAQLGIALFPADGDDGNTVFKNAEAALKRVKYSGERYAYHSSEMNAQIALRLQLEAQLLTAINAGQLVMHYQPRVDLISGELVGAEGLIRWQHPQRGLLLPLEFIELAEETGLIMPIGAWAIDAVCAQQAAWLAAGLSAVPIAVNLSSLQFEDGKLLQTVRTALAAHALDARYLDLELTESAVMNDAVAAEATLSALRKLGVGLAMDDFGTGYSSLAHLKRFPFDSVKIDRSFIIDVTSNVEDAAIASAIIAMAHSLNLKVVAEGVEFQGQFNYLRRKGCDEMQGNFFSPAVAADVFASYLSDRKRLVLPEPGPEDQRTLLLVDDEQAIRSAITRVLRRDGYRILSADSGSQGLEMLAVNPVQVIISDQRMAQMSGTEFLNTVKQLYPDTVRIILSGYTDLAVVTDAVNRGAVFKFLTKPWDDELLRDQVRDAFRRYRPTVGAIEAVPVL